jgi:hypothetical protein
MRPARRQDRGPGTARSRPRPLAPPRRPARAAADLPADTRSREPADAGSRTLRLALPTGARRVLARWRALRGDHPRDGHRSRGERRPRHAPGDRQAPTVRSASGPMWRSRSGLTIELTRRTRPSAMSSVHTPISLASPSSRSAPGCPSRSGAPDRHRVSDERLRQPIPNLARGDRIRWPSSSALWTRRRASRTTSSASATCRACGRRPRRPVGARLCGGLAKPSRVGATAVATVGGVP